MTQSDTGFSDVMYDLVAVQYHALKGGSNYAKYIQDAQSAGQQEIVQFLQQVQQQDADRAAQCHQLLGKLSGTEQAGPAAS